MVSAQRPVICLIDFIGPISIELFADDFSIASGNGVQSALVCIATYDAKGASFEGHNETGHNTHQAIIAAFGHL
jgi:hypothetical protein